MSKAEVIQHTRLKPFQPALSQNQTFKNELIKTVAKKIFTELAITFALTALTITFSATLFGIGAFILTNCVFLTICTAARIANALLEYKCHTLSQERSQESCEKVQFLRKIQKPLRWIAPIGFSRIDVKTRNVFTHEAGHALTASLVYKNARPRIEIFPGRGGSTSYGATRLTRFGRMLGWRRADFLVAAAGVGASLVVAIGSLFAAMKMKGDKELRMYLITTAIATIIQHFFYALSALWSFESSHDFVQLMRHGIHPITSAALIAIVPVISVLAFSALSKCFNKRTQPLLPA